MDVDRKQFHDYHSLDEIEESFDAILLEEKHIHLAIEPHRQVTGNENAPRLVGAVVALVFIFYQPRGCFVQIISFLLSAIQREIDRTG